MILTIFIVREFNGFSLSFVTPCNNVLHGVTTKDYLLMTVHVNGRLFYSTKDVVENLGISRQTLWRWRSEGKIPSGNRYRGNRIIFTEEEVSQVREYAEHIEPIEQINTPQLQLFDRAMGG